MFKVLSLVANTRPRPCAPVIDSLVDNAVLQFSPDGDQALHSKPFYSVLRVYGNNVCQVYDLKCVF